MARKHCAIHLQQLVMIKPINIIAMLLASCSSSNLPQPSTTDPCSSTLVQPNPNASNGCQISEYCPNHNYTVNCTTTSCVCWIDIGSDAGSSSNINNDGSFCFYANKAFDECKFPHN